MIESIDGARGRKQFRPLAAFLLLAVVAAAAGAGASLLGAGGTEVQRGPISAINSDAAPPKEVTVGAVRFIENAEPIEYLIVDTVPPHKKVKLLFFQGRPVQPAGEASGVTADGAGGLLRVSDDLITTRVGVNAEGRELVSAAGASNGGLWIVTGDGEVLRTDKRGELQSNTVGGFEYSLVASDNGGTAYLVRSPEQFTFQPVFGQTPLLLRLGEDGSVEGTLGGGVVPQDFMLTHLASAGRIVLNDSVIYYAPFIRDEVMAMNFVGDTLWVSSRGLPQTIDEPSFLVEDGVPSVDYAPVNTGLAFGPDEKLYVLSVPGFTTARVRIDVLDPSTGRLVRSAEIEDPLPTLAVDEDGRVYSLDPFVLLTGIGKTSRTPLQEFSLETIDSSRLDTSDIMNRVTLINFWASWCGPCRDEMPALDSLAKHIENEDFQFLTFNEDLSVEPAREFMNEFGFDFPVALGRGRLRDKFHYVGLPFTVLVDRHGQVVQRWIGFAGEAQIQGIHSVILAELNAGPTDVSSGEHAHH